MVYLVYVRVMKKGWTYACIRYKGTHHGELFLASRAVLEATDRRLREVVLPHLRQRRVGVLVFVVLVVVVISLLRLLLRLGLLLFLLLGRGCLALLALLRRGFLVGFV